MRGLHRGLERLCPFTIADHRGTCAGCWVPFRAFQHVAQRVLALDGHPSGGAGSDSDDWLEDSHNPSQISGRRLSAGLLGRGRLRSDYRRSQRIFRFLLQFDRTRRCLRAVLFGTVPDQLHALPPMIRKGERRALAQARRAAKGRGPPPDCSSHVLAACPPRL